MIIGIVIAAILLLAVWTSFDSSRKARQQQEQKLKDSWGRLQNRKYTAEEYENISHYFKATAGQTDSYLDDITWKDLDMDSIFRMMDNTGSSVGEEYLYRTLRMPKQKEEELQELETIIETAQKQPQDRLALQKIFAGLGYVRMISVSDYLDLLLQLKPGTNGIHIACGLSVLISLLICLFLQPVLGIVLLIVSIAFTIIRYYRDKAKVEKYFLCIRQIVRMVHAAKQISELPGDRLQQEKEELGQLADRFRMVVRHAGLLDKGNASASFFEVLLDYFRMLSHIDLIQFNRMIAHLDGRKEDISALMEKLGILETGLAAASFRDAFPTWCRPAFLAREDRRIELEEVSHPLLKEPVPNSIAVGQHVLLTGSNASGKSTFLRTVAINAVLAQTIATSISKQYRAPFFRIYSSMSLQDDLQQSSSYYMVEVKALKRILDAAADRDGQPVLCFVDEVLRGTNTVERIAASTAIMNYIAGQNALCFAATHDVELTTLLQPAYQNYHFQEEITPDGVRFPFLLYKGPATTRNAIRLLAMLGYDPQITEQAEKRAAAFLASGIWDCENGSDVLA